MWNKLSGTCLDLDLMQQTPGQLVVISGPSGSGKTTVLRRVFERCPWLESSVSATTRPPRPGEVDGEDYFFLSKRILPPAERGASSSNVSRSLAAGTGTARCKVKSPLDLPPENG